MFNDWFNTNDTFGNMFGGWNFNQKSFNGQEYDWEDLKKKGKVEESIEETNGIKTIVKTFTSFDGTSTITSVSSEPIFDKKSRLLEIEKEIKEAVSKEDYEKAGLLKLERDKIQNKKQ